MRIGPLAASRAGRTLRKIPALQLDSCTGEAPQQLKFSFEDMGMVLDVFVNAYERIRFGRTEHVCAHWRSRPA